MFVPKGSWAGRYLWLQDLGKDRDSRMGKKFKACRGGSKKRQGVCVCVWGSIGNGEGGVGKETIIGDI